METKLGIVQENTSIARDGSFKVCFDLQSPDWRSAEAEEVRYVSPYGSSHAALVAIPLPGSLVLCGYSQTKTDAGTLFKGYFYLGSVMGAIPGINALVPLPQDEPATNTSQEYVPKTKPGVHGPPVPDGFVAFSKNTSFWPDRFQDMYDAKGAVPEQVGLSNIRGDDVMISNRSRPDTAAAPYQDHRVIIESGNGKAVKCVDSPIVDGIVMCNEHKGKDYFIFSSGNSKLSGFSSGEWFMRTHGPVNMYTSHNNMHFWVEEGLNLQLENLAGGHCGRTHQGLPPLQKVTTNENGPNSRIYDFGNETWGCVEIRSLHNNVIIEALEPDSVIRIVAPGNQTKVIVNTGGTVDIIADKKITLRSGTEVEITAPEIDINGTKNVFIDGARIDLNLPHRAPQP